MATRFTVTFDCASPDRLARFWAAALGYAIEGPPAGFESWRAYWRSVGVPEEDAGGEGDSVADPGGAGPRLWFQRVPEGKVVKNRLHLDLHVGGGPGIPLEERKTRVDAEAARLVGHGATRVRTLEDPGIAHYAVAMQDPEGNEFDLN